MNAKLLTMTFMVHSSGTHILNCTTNEDIVPKILTDIVSLLILTNVC
jgi:hypothetical protein